MPKDVSGREEGEGKGGEKKEPGLPLLNIHLIRLKCFLRETFCPGSDVHSTPEHDV